jgi:hypothetical protein
MEPIDTKLEAFRSSVDKHLEQIDKRFDAVDEHFANQRGYIEFASERLEKSLATRLDRAERKLHKFIDLHIQSRQRRTR